MRREFIVALVVAFIVAGIVAWGIWKREHPDVPPPDAASIAAELEKLHVKILDEQRREVLSHPATFIEFSEATWYDKGIINHYRQLSSFDAIMHSPFPLKLKQMSVTFPYDQGGVDAILPVEAVGIIPAGGTHHGLGNSAISSPAPSRESPTGCAFRSIIQVEIVHRRYPMITLLLVTLLRIVDGDTLHVMEAGQDITWRLLNPRLSGKPAESKMSDCRPAGLQAGDAARPTGHRPRRAAPPQRRSGHVDHGRHP